MQVVEKSLADSQNEKLLTQYTCKSDE